VAAGKSSISSELAEHPHVFALPGNHDWYDSLVAFKQLFCSHVFNDRKFAADKDGNGGWDYSTEKKLFHIQAAPEVVAPRCRSSAESQHRCQPASVFRIGIRKMDRGDKVILCVPEPYWEKYIKYQGVTDKYEEKERSIFKLDRFFEDRGVE
jgi:predicted MPP superfamily phosphohydrolase